MSKHVLASVTDSLSFRCSVSELALAFCKKRVLLLVLPKTNKSFSLPYESQGAVS